MAVRPLLHVLGDKDIGVALPWPPTIVVISLEVAVVALMVVGVVVCLGVSTLDLLHRGVEVDDRHQFFGQGRPCLEHRPPDVWIAEAAEVVVDDVAVLYPGELVPVVEEPVGVLP